MIAISSAYKRALIGVKIDGKEFERELDANVKHSENIMPALADLLDENGLSLNQNDTLAVVVGPGSFTGIRIGISLVKGLKVGQENQKLIAITTFDLMAYSYIKNNIVKEDFTCVINALSDLFFVCTYDKNGKKLSIEKMIDKQEFENLQGIKVGLEEENITKITINPTAKELLSLAENKGKEGQFIEENKLLPLYLRQSQAEANLDEKSKNKKN